MSVKRLCVAVVFVMSVFAISAVAQDGHNEIGGMVGRIFISNQGITNASIPSVISFGKGLTFEGNYAHRFFVTPIFSVAGEAVVAYNPDEDINGGQYGAPAVPPQIKELFVTPAVRVNLFPTTAVSPWVSFGGGFGHFSQSSTLIYGGTNPGKNTTTGVIEGGIGLDVRVWKALSVRGEVRDFWSGEPDFPQAPTGKTRQHNFFVGGGVFWRF
ncbi:MAG TPA: outer membrane beta-barrel protein [Candidatus Sulfotelmatobacter sp.]|nr:outer membrane beta-barrel protein [Candidatus Sulfotelmatobacter sp.]